MCNIRLQYVCVMWSTTICVTSDFNIHAWCDPLLYVWHQTSMRAHDISHRIMSRIHVGDMSHVWTCHITHVNVSCYTCERVISHMWTCHVTHVNVSCHRCERVISHMWINECTWRYSSTHLIYTTHVVVSVNDSIHTCKWGVYRRNVYESYVQAQCVWIMWKCVTCHVKMCDRPCASHTYGSESHHTYMLKSDVTCMVQGGEDS